MIIICFYPVTHYMILLNKSTTKRRKIPVYLLFNKSQQKILSSTSQQNTIKYKDLYTITFSRVHVEESDTFFLFTSWAMGESLTCTCLLSIHGTLGEYDVNIKTHQEHLEDNLEQFGIFMIACHSHKLTFAKSTCM